MKISRFICAGICGVAMLSTQALLANHYPIQYSGLIQEGTGCPSDARPVVASVAQDGQSFLVSYPNSYQTSTSSGVKSIFCNLRVGLFIPRGLQAAVIDTAFAGTLELDLDTWARPDITLWFSGHLAEQVSFLGPVYTGPYSGDYVTEAVAAATRNAPWSPCSHGEVLDLNIKSRLTVRSLVAGAYAYASAENGESYLYSERYRLAYRTCQN